MKQFVKDWFRLVGYFVIAAIIFLIVLSVAEGAKDLLGLTKEIKGW
jgi:hypothetical protein